MKTYRVTARRSGDWWALSVPEIPGVHSQTKRLDQAPAEISEAIALMLDCEPTEFAVDVETDLEADLRLLLLNIGLARDAADSANGRLREAMYDAVLKLTADLSQRDVGTLLGVSFQRVHQLKAEAESAVQRLNDEECAYARWTPQHLPAASMRVEPGWTVNSLSLARHWLLDTAGVQARVVDCAIAHGGFISRADVFKVAGFPEKRQLKGFTRPITRVTCRLRESGFLSLDAGELLEAVYDPDVSGYQQVLGFRVPDEVLEVAKKEDCLSA